MSCWSNCPSGVVSSRIDLGSSGMGASYTCCPQRIRNALCLPPRDCPPMVGCAPIWTPCCSPPPRCCSVNCRRLCRLPPCPNAHYACPHKPNPSRFG